MTTSSAIVLVYRAQRAIECDAREELRRLRSAVTIRVRGVASYPWTR